jgi:hypothetical protein
MFLFGISNIGGVVVFAQEDPTPSTDCPPIAIPSNSIVIQNDGQNVRDIVAIQVFETRLIFFPHLQICDVERAILGQT